MPQMAPLNWVTLMMTFIIMFMILNSLNYFSFLYKNKPSTKTTKIKKINWKW